MSSNALGDSERSYTRDPNGEISFQEDGKERRRTYSYQAAMNAAE